MTQPLERAISETEKLSASEQDAIAAVIMEEIADERRWDDAFAGSQGALSRLAEKARADVRAGRVKDVGMDEL